MPVTDDTDANDTSTNDTPRKPTLEKIDLGTDSGSGSGTPPRAAGNVRVDLGEGPGSTSTAASESPGTPAPGVSVTAGARDAERIDGAGRPRSSRRPVMALAAASVVLLVATVVLSVLAFRFGDAESVRSAHLQAARQTALNITTLAPESIDADIQRIVDGATGQFKDEFAGKQSPFADVVQQYGVTTEGQVLDAGVQKVEGNCGTSLVAARAMVRNNDTPEQQQRDFRLRITTCDEGGRYLASKVDFVP